MVGPAMPTPMGLPVRLAGAPTAASAASTVGCSAGLTPRPPSPSGKCTHARPRSYWAPRNVAASSFLGSRSASRRSSLSRTCVSSLTVAPLSLPTSNKVRGGSLGLSRQEHHEQALGVGEHLAVVEQPAGDPALSAVLPVEGPLHAQLRTDRRDLAIVDVEVGGAGVGPTHVGE